MLKKIGTFLLAAALVVGLVFVYLSQKNNQRDNAQQLKSANIAIQELEAERDTLTAQLEELEAETGDESTEVQEVEQAAAPQAVFCLNTVTEQTYTEVYPALHEKGITGILILRNGQLPGDNYCLTVEQFLEMIDDGWSFGISLQKDADRTDESWQNEIELYMSNLKQRTDLTPAIYCFAEGGCTASEAGILIEEGFDTVLVHEQVVSEYDELKIIRLFSYAQEDLTDTLSSMEGYCGLEMWIGWSSSTEEDVRYYSDQFNELLDLDAVQLTCLEDLMPVVAQAEESEQTEDRSYTDADSIRRRLAQIEEEIKSLYK